jgi:hypothetical protein
MAAFYGTFVENCSQLVELLHTLKQVHLGGTSADIIRLAEGCPFDSSDTTR